MLPKLLPRSIKLKHLCNPVNRMLSNINCNSSVIILGVAFSIFFYFWIVKSIEASINQISANRFVCSFQLVYAHFNSNELHIICLGCLFAQFVRDRRGWQLSGRLFKLTASLNLLKFAKDRERVQDGARVLIVGLTIELSWWLKRESNLCWEMMTMTSMVKR